MRSGLCYDHFNGMKKKPLEDNIEIRDAVRPSHYKDVYPAEAFEIMKGMYKACYGDEWKKYYEGFLIGNEWKYRLRAGFKGDDKENIEKAKAYNKQRRDLCSDEK